MCVSQNFITFTFAFTQCSGLRRLPMAVPVETIWIQNLWILANTVEGSITLAMNIAVQNNKQNPFYTR